MCQKEGGGALAPLAPPAPSATIVLIAKPCLPSDIRDGRRTTVRLDDC